MDGCYSYFIIIWMTLFNASFGHLDINTAIQVIQVKDLSLTIDLTSLV